MSIYILLHVCSVAAVLCRDQETSVAKSMHPRLQIGPIERQEKESGAHPRGGESILNTFIYKLYVNGVVQEPRVKHQTPAETGPVVSETLLECSFRYGDRPTDDSCSIVLENMYVSMICLFVVCCCLSVCLFVCLSVCLFVCLSVCLFVCLSVCLFVCLFVVCCLLFVVCCLLFVVCCLLFVVCCLLFVVCCLFVVCLLESLPMIVSGASALTLSLIS